MSDIVKAATPMESNGEGASTAKTGPGLQHVHALELPRGIICLTGSISSNGKRSICLPGAEDPLVKAETHSKAEITKSLHPFTKENKENSKQTNAPQKTQQQENESPPTSLNKESCEA